MEAKLIPTMMRLTNKEKKDIAALAAAWAFPLQKVMEYAITAYIKDNYDAVQQGYQILKAGRQVENEQAQEMPRQDIR